MCFTASCGNLIAIRISCGTGDEMAYHNNDVVLHTLSKHLKLICARVEDRSAVRRDIRNFKRDLGFLVISGEYHRGSACCDLLPST